jgi:D-cysteine desulfhydrase
MIQPDSNKISVDNIWLPAEYSHSIKLDMLRLDKIHPVISGNKWFKLKYHLENFRSGSYKGILTFGGSWSNHIVATACACSLEKIPAIGIIRGEKPAALSASLQQAMQYGMHLEFIPRKLYMDKHQETYLQSIHKAYPGYYLIPEGGAGEAGEKGAGEILQLVQKDAFTHFICAVGTGTFFNGIRKNVFTPQQVWGIVVLKGWEKKSLPAGARLFYDYHFGGYAKKNTELIAFMNDFFRLSAVPTDFVYTGKMVFAVFDLLKKNAFPPGSKILMIHSGGLQGNRSMPADTLIF